MSAQSSTARFAKRYQDAAAFRTTLANYRWLTGLGEPLRLPRLLSADARRLDFEFIHRLSVIVVVAKALKVELGQLSGQPFLVRNGEEFGEGVPGIRRALTGRDALAVVLGGAAGEVEPPNLDQLRRDVAQCWAVRQAGRYATLTGMLPDLIVRAEAAVHAAVGDPGTTGGWRGVACLIALRRRCPG